MKRKGVYISITDGLPGLASGAGPGSKIVSF